MKPRLLALILKTVGKHPEIEYVNLTIDIAALVITKKELRKVIFTTGLTED